MSLYAQAILFMNKYHSGQKRRSGSPYIVHPLRVAAEVEGLHAKVTALLHDVVEDYEGYKIDIITAIHNKFPKEVYFAVMAISKTEDESYDEYLSRVIQNDIARQVKIADICDNLADQPSEKQIEKYARALSILIE